MSDVLTQAEVSYSGLDRLLDGRYQVIQILATGAWGVLIWRKTLAAPANLNA